MSRTINCPICNCETSRLWGRRNGFNLYFCGSCDHRFADLGGEEFSRSDPQLFRDGLTHGLMSSDEAYYQHLKEGEDPGRATSITATKALQICRKAGPSAGTWLDVGCGSGHLLARARAQGYSVLGIEPGGWGQLAAAEKGLKVIQAFLEEDTLEDRFSVVSATDVIEHVSEPVKFLRILRHYLASDGVLVFSIPYADSFERRIFGVRWNMVEPPTHSQFFSRSSLDAALNAAGLSLTSIEQFSIRPFLGLGHASWFRSTIDRICAGPQIVALARRI